MQSSRLLPFDLNQVFSSIDFSVFKSLRCYARCKSCQLVKDDIGKRLDENEVLDLRRLLTLKDRYLKIFKNFERINLVDDLFFVKSEWPEQFNFIASLSDCWRYASLNDNNLFRQENLLLNTSAIDSIGQIVISESFIGTVGIDKIVSSISNLAQSKKINSLVIEFAAEKRDYDWVTVVSNLAIRFGITLSQENKSLPTNNSGLSKFLILGDMFYFGLESALAKKNGVELAQDHAALDSTELIKNVFSFKLSNGNEFNKNYNFIPYSYLRADSALANALLHDGKAVATSRGLFLMESGLADGIIFPYTAKAGVVSELV